VGLQSATSDSVCRCSCRLPAEQLRVFATGTKEDVVVFENTEAF
jgi:hypothetical protein